MITFRLPTQDMDEFLRVIDNWAVKYGNGHINLYRNTPKGHGALIAVGPSAKEKISEMLNETLGKKIFKRFS